MPNKFEIAREKYKPDKINCLMIAEAPPAEESDRFFYFEQVWEQDSLFLETMKVLYSEKYTSPIEVRRRKKEFLDAFKDEGFYLIDSVEFPITGTYAQRKDLISEKRDSLIKKMHTLVDNNTPIVLITKTVYEACCKRLKQEGFNIINEEMIPFAGNGQQAKYREKLQNILWKHNLIKANNNV